MKIPKDQIANSNTEPKTESITFRTDVYKKKAIERQAKRGKFRTISEYIEKGLHEILLLNDESYARRFLKDESSRRGLSFIEAINKNLGDS